MICPSMVTAVAQKNPGEVFSGRSSALSAAAMRIAEATESAALIGRGAACRSTGVGGNGTGTIAPAVVGFDGGSAKGFATAPGAGVGVEPSGTAPPAALEGPAPGHEPATALP